LNRVDAKPRDTLAFLYRQTHPTTLSLQMRLGNQLFADICHFHGVPVSKLNVHRRSERFPAEQRSAALVDP
jgi:hypothetical protein